MSNLLLAAQILADGVAQHREPALKEIKAAILAGENLSEKNNVGLRAIDVIVQGADTLEAVAAIEAMAETEFASEMLKPPMSSIMPPVIMAAYSGNALMVEKFLDFGFPADSKFTAAKQNLLNGTAFHAVVLGYREIKKEAYVECMALLMAYCPTGIDVADMRKQRPVDLAIKYTASTRDRTLSTAIITFGAHIETGSKIGAKSLMAELIKKQPEYADFTTMLTRGAARNALRAIEREVQQEETPIASPKNRP